MRKLDVKAISQLGLLIAVEIICTRFIAIETQFMRLSFSFIPLAIMGYLFGPWLAGMGGIIGDIIGMIVFPKAAYFPGFTLNAFLVPFIYGLFFNKKEFSLKKNVAAQVTIAVLVSLILTPIWLNIMFKMPIMALLPARLLKEVIKVPIQVIMTQIILNNQAIYRRLTSIKKA